MSLYRVEFDAQDYWIEAADFADAVQLWKRHVAVEWGADFTGEEQPESVEHVTVDPVISWGRIANAVPARKSTNDRYDGLLDQDDHHGEVPGA